MVANEKWFGASAGFYPEIIDQSLRFNKADTPYLERTFVTPSSTRKVIIATWIKPSELGDTTPIMYSAPTSATSSYFLMGFAQSGFIGSKDSFKIFTVEGSSTKIALQTDARFRDITNWLHVCVAIDSEQATSTDRVMIFFNGKRYTGSYDTYNTFPSVNHDFTVMNSAIKHRIGATSNGLHANYGNLNGYLSEFYFIDGQSMFSDNSAEVNSTFLNSDADTLQVFCEQKNGVAVPKAYSGTFGNNGCRLTFEGTGTATTSQGTTAQTNIGDDQSGQGHNFSVNGLASTDVVLDSPTNNFCTLNSLSAGDANDLSQGNLQYADNRTSGTGNAKGTFPLSSGKWYWEVHYDYDNGSNMVGIVAVDEITTSHTATDPNTGFGTYFGWDERGYYYQATDGSHSSTTGHTSYATGDIISFALDVDGGKLFIRKNNGSWEDSANPVNGTNPSFTFTANKVMTPMVNNYKSSRHIFNFGQNPSFNGDGSITAGTETDSGGIGLFKYAPPTDYLAICSANLPDTTISPNQSEQADDHFNTILYTGNGFPTSDGQTISGVGFQPDWTWIKDRSRSGYNHYLLDTNRSATKVLRTTSANAEGTEGTSLTSWNSDGFVLGANNEVNYQNDSFVAWNWKAGGTTPTKTYKVKVVADSTDYGHGTGANKYQFFKSDGTTGFGTNGVDIDLQEGGTYVFDWSDSTAQGHPLRFSLTNNGTHGGGSEYTTGVVKDDSAYKTTITVASGVANLYYYCQLHSGMGAEVRTNTTHGSTNFDGTILSVSQENTTSGFSIVTYTGTGSAGTIGHGLGVKPKHIAVKSRSHNGTAFQNYHSTEGATKYVSWYASQASASASDRWNNTEPTTDVFSVGTHVGVNNSSSYTYVAYCFAEVEGFSKISSYTGNSSADGTFVYTGFRPSWILVKRTASGNWYMYDNKRNTSNVLDLELNPNTAQAEATFTTLDFLSNGFKLRTSNDAFNVNTYIYIAFAEQPFKFSNAR